ncbi:DNA methyltransferase [Methanofollis ethanolicus]|uniref:DNA methyltransferase n=1 Tax=Methanofollis ethanolicus TaxID=488124 RepID=UPI000AD56A9E|nr:DNA methyltransferase [Methanofollis ethanolicus]
MSIDPQKMKTILQSLLSYDWNFPDAANGNGIFNLHPYPAKFIPQIPRALIKELGVPEGTLVCDPFCGSGTSLIEAQNQGYQAIGIDLNPIACMISHVATHPCSDDLLTHAQRCIRQAKLEQGTHPVPPIQNIDHWFKKPIQLAITSILVQINNIQEDDLRKVLQLALSSIIVRVSNQDSDTRYAAVEKNVTDHDVYTLFERACIRYSQVLRHADTPIPQATILNKDILSVTPDDFPAPVGLVVCSPPYPNAYEYWLYHKYRMFWLGFNPQIVKTHEIGARPHFFKKNPQGPMDFKEQMTQVFNLLAQVCVPEAFVCFVLGDSKIRGQIIDNSKLLLDAASTCGFGVRAVIPRSIPNSKKSFNLSHARIQNENIIILQKKSQIDETVPINLDWHKYHYLPYEKKFALREVAALPSLSSIVLNDDHVTVGLTNPTEKDLKQLVYFKTYDAPGLYKGETYQSTLERGIKRNENGKKQSTRYSVHGLHEYKGKFNPQVVRGILNWFNLPEKAQIIDPFCGSGTTLVEASFAGYQAYGWDLNPFAVYLTNTKLLALKSQPEYLEKIAEKIIKGSQNSINNLQIEDERAIYLKKWFPLDVLNQIEKLRLTIDCTAGEYSPIFKVVLSDLLRDYSFQEPSDLRIRRRTTTPFPTTPILSAYKKSLYLFIEDLKQTFSVFPELNPVAKAFVADGRSIESIKGKSPVKLNADFAITSPPYATALPYIDTQRLSLVWLDLIHPKEILSTEKSLIGSRDISKGEQDILKNEIKCNTMNLPPSALDICSHLQQSLAKTDGFRRQAVPSLLYRYFVDMKCSFANVLNLMKPNSYYTLIVGTNRTVLGGEKETINTPELLVDIAISTGWHQVEQIKMDTYKRYGLHATNAVQDEVLLVLKK